MIMQVSPAISRMIDLGKASWPGRAGLVGVFGSTDPFSPV
jgi:hypothetical protein